MKSQTRRRLEEANKVAQDILMSKLERWSVHLLRYREGLVKKNIQKTYDTGESSPKLGKKPNSQINR